ncbi:unnamed protein product [Pedinophyceae sp. YPF-701]|nr:unnamed protein product [Pedinophyceae sp. YPF-701]
MDGRLHSGMEKPLKGQRVVAGNLKGRTAKEEVRRTVLELGGEFLAEATTNSAPTVLIAENTTSEKYMMFSERGVPCVHQTWLEESRGLGRPAPFESHRIKCFEGVKISCTGFQGRARYTIEHSVPQEGGIYASNLDGTCTHLVCAGPSGAKWEAAVKWQKQNVRIHIVTRDWLEACVREGRRVDERRYPVRTTGEAARAERAQTLQQRVAAAAGASLQHSRDGASLATSSLPGGGPASLDNGARAVAASDARPGPPSHTTSAPDVRPPPQTATAPSFALGHATLWAAGLSQPELRDLADFIGKTGARRLLIPDDRVTHAVLGPLLTERERREVGRLRDVAGPRLELVKLEWMAMCAALGEVVPLQGPDGRPDPRYTVSPAALGVRAGGATLATEPRRAEAVDAAPARDGPLAGAVFDLSPLGALDEQASRVMDIAVELVRRGGGVLLHDALAAPGGARGASYYAVCPEVMAPAQREALKHAAGAQSGLRIAGIGNTFWLKFCVKHALKLVDPARCVAFQPLSRPPPLPGFPDVKACVSGYPEPERQIAWYLTTLLGGSFSEQMSRSTTHLIVEQPKGPKYDACPRFQSEPVTLKWLYRAVTDWRLPDPRGYRPGAEAGVVPAHSSEPQPSQAGSKLQLQPAVRAAAAMSQPSAPAASQRAGAPDAKRKGGAQKRGTKPTANVTALRPTVPLASMANVAPPAPSAMPAPPPRSAAGSGRSGGSEGAAARGRAAVSEMGGNQLTDQLDKLTAALENTNQAKRPAPPLDTSGSGSRGGSAREAKRRRALAAPRPDDADLPGGVMMSQQVVYAENDSRGGDSGDGFGGGARGRAGARDLLKRGLAANADNGASNPAKSPKAADVLTDLGLA